MSKLLRICVLAALSIAPAAMAFSLLGPFTPWQTVGLSYQRGGAIGGPMNLREGFRWNVPVITYACDKSFIDYFGPEGVRAIDEAVRFLNDLPAPSNIDEALSDFSTQTMRENFEAQTLGLIDLKSSAMKLLLEELGFADPVRYTFTLRARMTETIGGVTFTNYTTILRNFDPVTLSPTRYVNGTLYTYEIFEFRNPDRADALELVRFDDDGIENLPVASGLSTFSSFGQGISFGSGLYRVGLTRDDVGGIRFLYHPQNYAVETLLPTITAGNRVGNGSTWVPFLGITNVAGVTNVVIGTNTLGTNIVSVGLRGGRKLKFQRVFFDGLTGSSFTTISNIYTDVLVGTNSTLVVQPVVRAIARPDIIFVAEDLGLAADNLTPVLAARTTTANWIDNDAINGNDEIGVESRGPGVIAPPVQILFSDQLPFFQNIGNFEFLDGFPGEDTSFTSGVWGSFDGTTNAPVIYPRYRNITVQQLRNQILTGGNNSGQ